MNDALTIRPAGSERALPTRYLGLNAPVPYEIPYEDPAFVAPLREVAPAWLRYPGGTVANYFNWRTGHLEVPVVEGGASIYRKFLVQIQPWTYERHPNGSRVEDFVQLARDVGAGIVFVPNLETSTVAEQAAWFEDMHQKGIVPSMIEMGNEFFLTLLYDSLTRSIFPNWRTAIDITKEYLDAFQRYLPSGAKIAVQCASSRFHHVHRPGPEMPIAFDEWNWDDDMTDEGWFDAVTSHPYPALGAVVTRELATKLPETVDAVFPALMARADEGYDRAFEFITNRMPGKEIWVTEWGPITGVDNFVGTRLPSSGLWLHQTARATMAQLRHPAITVSTYHSAFADGGIMAVFRKKPSGDGWERTGNAGLMSWFDHAVNGGATYQRVEVAGAARLRAEDSTIKGETYWDVDACLLRKDGRSTLFVHNAGKEPVSVALSEILKGARIASAEALVTPDLCAAIDEELLPATTLTVSEPLSVPGYSFTKVEWTA